MATDYGSFGAQRLEDSRSSSDDGASSYTPKSSSSGRRKKKNSGTDYSSFGSQRLADQQKAYEDAADSRKLAESKKAEQQKKAAPKGEGFLKDAIKNVGAVVGEVAKSATSAYKRVGEGVGEVIAEATGVNDRVRKENAKRQDEDFKDSMALIQKIKTETDPAKKQRYQSALNVITKTSNDAQKSFQDRQKEIADRTDPAKGGAAVGEIGLDVITGGTLKTARDIIKGTKAVREGVAVAQKASLAKKVGKGAAAGAPIGAAYGGLGQVEEKGSDVKAGDIIKGAATGAAIGTALPLAGGGARALKNAAPVKATEKAVHDTVAKAVSKVGETKFGQSVGNVTEKLATKFVDSLAPVVRDFGNAVDNKTGRKIVEEVREKSTNVVNSAAINEQNLQKNAGFNKLKEVLAPTNEAIPGAKRGARKEAKDIGEFISAKQDAVNFNKTKKAKEATREVPVGTEKQEAAYKALNEATKPVVQYAYDNNLITKANYTKYMNDADYTRVQKDMSDLIDTNFKGVGGPNASISSTPFQQKLTGKSKRESIDPFVAFYDWSNKVTKAAQRQNLSSYIIEQRKGMGKGMGYVRDADSVEARAAASGEAAQLRVLRNNLGKAVKVETTYAKRLQNEIDGLNKKGLQESLKGAGTKAATPTKATRTVSVRDTPENVKVKAPQKLDDIKTSYTAKAKLEKAYGKKADSVQKMNRDLKSGGVKRLQEKAGVSRSTAQNIAKQLRQKPVVTEASRTVTEGKIGKTSSSKKFIDSLVNVKTSELKRIQKKLGNREPKLRAAIDNIIGIKTQHEVASKAVKALTDIARANRDGITKNKATIKTFNRGIKEIWEDEPRVVNAINKVGRIEMHAALKVFTLPSTVVQRTATSINSVFALKNLPRDQISSFINSKNGFATHNPVSFLLGLNEAVAKPLGRSALETIGAKDLAKKLGPSEQYTQFLKYVAGQNQVDITRGMKKAARATYEALGLKNENPLRKVEAVSSATENATRYQNFVGTYRSAVKNGMDEDAAYKEAIQAARENSVDFAQSGDFAPFLKIFNPFMNANIQGSRTLLRALKERPIGTTLKIVSTIGIPVAASTYYNLSDPKRALIYSQLSDSDREGNLLFITEEGSVVKFPLPPGVRNFAGPIRGTIEAQYGISDPQDFAKTAKQIIGIASPFSGDPVGNVVPVAVKPLVENWANKSFFTGKEIIPDNLKDKDPDQQVFKGTSQTYRDIAKAFGVSPLKVQQVVSGYFTSSGEQAVSLYDQLRKAGGVKNENGEPIATSKRNTAEQIKSGFFADKPDQQKAANNTFFKAYDPLKAQRDKTSKEVTSLLEEGRAEAARRKAEEFNASLRGKFGKFNSDYGPDNKEVSQEDYWDDMISGLYISSSDRAFKARLR